ncbi:DUF4189 domain-containing protein [Nocardia heshunensis]
MSLSRKAASGLIASASAALMVAGMGTAHADSGDLYGAIAVADLGDSWAGATSFDAPDQATADNVALSHCGYTNCTIEVRWSNGCAAVSSRTGDGPLWWALGSTQAQAEAAALAAAGPDPNPLMVSLGSAEPSRAHIVDSVCTRNAG